jgi:hypothetical protein
MTTTTKTKTNDLAALTPARIKTAGYCGNLPADNNMGTPSFWMTCKVPTHWTGAGGARLDPATCEAMVRHGQLVKMRVDAFTGAVLYRWHEVQS